MKININPDKQKSESLKIMAEITMKRLLETDLSKYPSNTLTDYYDIIHKLLEAISLKDGVKFKGEGAHQELIDFITIKYELGEDIRIFLQNMRDNRNRISYEGFMINENYIKLNKEKIETIINKMLSLL
jgi:hypothetical protein